MSIKAMNWVWQDVRVEGGLKLVLLAIADCAEDTGLAWPSMQMIADKAGVSVRTAQRKVDALERLGLFTVEHRAAGYNSVTNKYLLPIGQKFDFTGGGQ